MQYFQRFTVVAMLLLFCVPSSSVEASTAKEWKKLPPKVLKCFRLAAEHENVTLEQIIASGLKPSDQRLAPTMQVCQQYAKEMRNGFDCTLTDPNGNSVRTLCREYYVDTQQREITADDALQLSLSGQSVQIMNVETPEGLAARQAAISGELAGSDADTSQQDNSNQSSQSATTSSQVEQGIAGVDMDVAKAAFRNSDYRQSYQVSAPAAEAGNAEAQYYVGIAYILLPDMRDLEKGRLWLEKSAAQGYGLAQADVGRLYLFGEEGFDKNEKLGIEYLKKAANDPDALTRANFFLGKAYEEGLGVTPSASLAASYYKTSCSIVFGRCLPSGEWYADKSRVSLERLQAASRLASSPLKQEQEYHGKFVCSDQVIASNGIAVSRGRLGGIEAAEAFSNIPLDNYAALNAFDNSGLVCTLQAWKRQGKDLTFEKELGSGRYVVELGGNLWGVTLP
jgi:hypothetical protein